MVDAKAAWRSKNPLKAIFATKRANAKHVAMPFTLRFEDIEWPERCPALGTLLEYAGSAGQRDPRVTPSFDRIDSSLGYVRGNVQIISQAANMIKNQFSPREIRLVADWLARRK